MRIQTAALSLKHPLSRKIKKSYTKYQTKSFLRLHCVLIGAYYKPGELGREQGRPWAHVKWFEVELLDSLAGRDINSYVWQHEPGLKAFSLHSFIILVNQVFRTLYMQL